MRVNGYGETRERGAADVTLCGQAGNVADIDAPPGCSECLRVADSVNVTICKSCQASFVGYAHCLPLCLRCSHIQLKNAEGTLAVLDREAL